MSKIGSKIAKAGMAAVMGYEVGTMTKEVQIVRVESPPPVYTAPPVPAVAQNPSELREIMYVFGSLLVILIIVMIYKLFVVDKRRRNTTVVP